MNQLANIMFIVAISIATSYRLFNQNSNKKKLQATTDPSTPTQTNVIEKSNFLTYSSVLKIKEKYGSPVYVYDEATLRSQAQKALNFPNSFGLKVRFAMKASPNAAILQIFKSMGINFDASSGYEIERAIKAGIDPKTISLSSQELPHNFEELIDKGIEFNACSLNQLETFGRLFPGKACGVRFNPGKGSGGTGKTVSHFKITLK